MLNPATFCSFEGAHYLLFGPNVAPLVYYSHLPTILISLALGIYILLQDRKALPNQILFFTILSFVAWVFCDSIYWASNRSDVVMLTWSYTILFEPLVYIACLYLLYVLVDKHDVSFKTKLIWFVLFFPIAIIVPSQYSLTGVDLSTCLANETWWSYYSYVIEIVFALWIAFFAGHRYRAATTSEKRREIMYLAAGVLLLDLAFMWGNLIGSFTDDWELAQYGLFGMPVFTAFLVYSIVKYKTFNIKVLGAVALVFGLCALTFALIFVQDIQVFRGVGLATFVLSVVFGLMLIRSVKREVRQRELIEKQEQELEVVNKQQENLLHFISHEVKGYLTEGEAGFAAITEGDYGDIPDTLKGMATNALSSMRKGVATVMDILSASSLKKGTVSFNKTRFDFRIAVQTTVQEQQKAAQEKGLTLDVHMAEGKYRMEGDEEKLREHVIRNLIDNAIKYTPTGTVEIELSDGDGKIHFAVQDSGVGITPEDMKNLFTEGGHGKDSIKVNVHSTGYGLFIAKQVVEAHGGKIWAESKGGGRGARFIVELPAV